MVFYIEYGSKGMISTKGDVYSYGVMLLETFTGRKPTYRTFVGEMSLKHWADQSVHCAVIEIIYVNILRRDDKDFIIKECCIKSIQELAISSCTES